jgi:transposase
MEMIQIPKEEYDAMKTLIATLTAELIELKAQLNKTSKNSNKPPSTDGLGKGKIKNNRISSGKQSGGQLGHAGATKSQTLTPEIIIKLPIVTTCTCGGNVVLQTDDYIARQVTDMQPARVITKEYRVHKGVCASCGKVHKSDFPTGVTSPVSYGANLKAIATYLTNYQLIPLKRTTELLNDLYGIKISEGTIVATNQEAYEKLEGTEEHMKEELIESDVVNFDESGMRENGKTRWLHSAGTKDCTVYIIHEKRGKEATDAMGILPLFRGTAVHDHWKTYYKYDQCAHAECNQHHLRALKYLYEDLNVAWAKDMATLLCRINHHVELSKCFGANHLEMLDITEYEGLYRAILATADTSKEAPKEARRMAKRLAAFEPETLLFMLDFNVPFTNNLAERDIRMPKTKLKISGGFRSVDGAKSFARTRGFISTLKKKGKNVLEGLVSAFNGDSETFLYPRTPL